jgi:hypothetical protein
MPSRNGSANIGVDASSAKDLQRFMRELRKFSPELAKETRAKFKTAAGPALADVRRRQPVRSGELRRKTKIRVARGRVEIRSSAPHARISELGGRRQLWGRDQWMAQKAAPAVFPGTAAHRDDFVRQAGDAVSVAAKRAGFK